MITVLVVALGAAIGAPMRFALERAVVTRGLLVVNLVGSLIAGIVLATTSGLLQQFLLIGFCGALTTYSGFAWQAANAWRERRRMFWPMIAVMTLGCALVFWLGYTLSALAVG